MTRNEAREILMQIVFEMESARTMNAETAEKLAEDRLSGNHISRGKNLLKYITEHIEEIDHEINTHSRSWKTGRMPKVDLAIMRLSIGEVRACDDIPTAVSVNEAINLARKYSTPQSSRYIHGVLGSVFRENE
ncbi:MAG: transcription antitermination factor NusB [Lentihominibacter sp.]